jgi:hypothetical protein
VPRWTTDGIRKRFKRYRANQLKLYPDKFAKLPQECKHLLDPTEETVQVFGCGCRSETVLTTVWMCELYGRCIIVTNGKEVSDPSVMRCGKHCGKSKFFCSDYERKQ